MDRIDTQALATALRAAESLSHLGKMIEPLAIVFGGFALLTAKAIEAGLLSDAAMLEWVSAEHGRSGAAEFEKLLKRIALKTGERDAQKPQS